MMLLAKIMVAAAITTMQMRFANSESSPPKASMPPAMAIAITAIAFAIPPVRALWIATSLVSQGITAGAAANASSGKIASAQTISSGAYFASVLRRDFMVILLIK